jgi:hypothetical protein
MSAAKTSLAERVKNEMNTWQKSQKALRRKKTKTVIINSGGKSELVLPVDAQTVGYLHDFNIRLINALVKTKEALLIGSLSAKNSDDINALLKFVNQNEISAFEFGVNHDLVDRVDLLPTLKSIDETKEPDETKLTPSFAFGFKMLTMIHPQ